MFLLSSPKGILLIQMINSDSTNTKHLPCTQSAASVTLFYVSFFFFNDGKGGFVQSNISQVYLALNMFISSV